jgi:hypothetical protein
VLSQSRLSIWLPHAGSLQRPGPPDATDSTGGGHDIGGEREKETACDPFGGLGESAAMFELDREAPEISTPVEASSIKAVDAEGGETEAMRRDPRGDGNYRLNRSSTRL